MKQSKFKERLYVYLGCFPSFIHVLLKATGKRIEFIEIDAYIIYRGLSFPNLLFLK